MQDAPRSVPCSVSDCTLEAKRIFSCMQVAGDLPGQQILKEEENDAIFTKARIARRRKRSGEVPMNACLKLGDKEVDASQYFGPRELPVGHPEAPQKRSR